MHYEHCNAFPPYSGNENFQLNAQAEATASAYYGQSPNHGHIKPQSG